jgi:hypothetical protein
MTGTRSLISSRPQTSRTGGSHDDHGQRAVLGIVAPLMPAGMIAEAAKQQEDMGLQGTFAAQVYGPPWTALAAAATTTTRLQLASGIAQAFVRSPFEIAMTAMDLDRISGGGSFSALAPRCEAGARAPMVCRATGGRSYTFERRSR